MENYKSKRNLVMMIVGVVCYAILGFGLSKFELLLLMYVFMIAVILMDM